MHDTDYTGPMPGAPSPRRLLRSTLIALAVAIAILVMIVLPAEYGIDPTGVGRILGLKEMGEIKMQLAREEAAAANGDTANVSTTADSVNTSAPPAPTNAAAPPTPAASPAPSSTIRSDVTEIVLQSNEGKEIKLVMQKDARVTYSWATNRGVVNYDTHADAPGIRYHGYAKGTRKASDEGELVAAFDGAHGWFWRNRGRDPVTVTLRTSGHYQEIKRIP